MLKEVITIKKILFGITSLTLGGAERVLVDISNKLSEKYDITIFSIYDNGELKNDLNKNVKFKALYNCRYDESQPEIYRDSVVRFGYCDGKQTFNFVNNIMENYTHYKNTIKK